MNTYTQESVSLKNIETPYGRLYQPLGIGWQLAVMVGVFGSGILLSRAVGAIPGDLSEAARVFLYIPLLLIFFLGYSQWITKCNAITLNEKPQSLLSMLFQVITQSRKPKTVEDVLPPQEKFVELMVRAQQAGTSFRIVSLPIGMISGFIAMFFVSSMPSVHLFALITLSCILWGNGLAFLGRRCYLPMPEQN